MKPLLVLQFALPAMAQRRSDGEDAAAAGCAALCGSILLVPIALFVIHIALLVWVARDAKARSLNDSVVWMILVLFTGVVGLIIYILSRPKGELRQCASCRNQRLQASAICPHCGNA